MEIFDPENKYVTKRFKLFWVDCQDKGIDHFLAEAEELDIPTLNIGKEIASFLKDNEGSKFLSLETEEELKKLINQNSKVLKSGNSAIAIYNLGILLEPAIKIDGAKILKVLSKDVSIIILWEALCSDSAYFYWIKENDEYGFSFSDANINKITLQYEV
ncbi:MAG: hypothetical protein JWO44_364 [Bacteroidetes bacterium]|nr:hypothetical protein [Bacteroidota bacterium]